MGAAIAPSRFSEPVDLPHSHATRPGGDGVCPALSLPPLTFIVLRDIAGRPRNRRMREAIASAKASPHLERNGRNRKPHKTSRKDSARLTRPTCLDRRPGQSPKDVP
ncbi:hypothetical protein jaqu_38390 [Jannaschia aquimarina]|uniref:Uncharacterized protein n=1 Tax=Jannaschia aquimarina TaxID=935700 RepID=A0A0D1EA38_9RHOB|nr:hypothetical protein jaqu_38390 [Jannaschia aquimarina]SNT35357.1 hypothetical protein SAMN05421775_112113 [Jannaschia aquimarina]